MSRLERDRAAALAASKASQAKAKRENAKHTPGPWEAVIQPGCHAVIASLSGGPKAVAIIGNNTPDDGNEPMRFANARLIAGAPDLLAALQRIVAVLDKQVASPHLAERASPLAQAKAAISKATGETA